MKRKNEENNQEVNNYIKTSFIRRLPFGVKATFIKYWFFGAVYFFCFMGLGLVAPNENLVLISGLVGGAFFDIALYNIYLLIAETREQASKWWIFKSKKFYSIFINAVIQIGLWFAFYFIVVPIKKSTPESLVWLFQEPFTAAILLVTMDTALCWIKNGCIALYKKIFKLDKDYKRTDREAYIIIKDVSPVSVTIEVNNKSNFIANKPFNVLLDNEIILKKVTTNVLTIYDLKPDTKYRLTINRENIVFTTSKISKFYKVFEGNDIQNTIDNADQYSLIVVNKGIYNIKSLTLKNNITLYFRKGVVLNANNDANEYPILSEQYKNNEYEIYGHSDDEVTKIRQSIINIDHVDNVKIIAEANLNLEQLKNINSEPLPYLVFINHSNNISLVGLTIKNPLKYCVDVFYSEKINLSNLTINSSNYSNGILVQCSNNVDISGTTFLNCNQSICFDAPNFDIPDVYQKITKDINIKNCNFKDSNNSIYIGDNLKASVGAISILNSQFINIKNPVVITSNINFGENVKVYDISFIDIYMENVLTPIIINIDDSKANANKYKETYGLPYFNNFVFKNISVKDFELCSAAFIGLKNKYIQDITIENCNFEAKNDSSKDYPIVKKGIDKCSKNGIILKNIKTFNLKNTAFTNIVDEKLDIENVSEIIEK